MLAFFFPDVLIFIPSQSWSEYDVLWDTSRMSLAPSSNIHLQRNITTAGSVLREPQ
jgi:hypothetical protein